MRLFQVGLDVQDYTRVINEFDINVKYQTDLNDSGKVYEGHQFSDYVLLGNDGKPFAVVEEKNFQRCQTRAGTGKTIPSQYPKKLLAQRLEVSLVDDILDLLLDRLGKVF